MKRRSEGNQGERKWDIEKWTKITLFQGENSVFVNRQNKKTKRKERLRANCPKTHVQGCVDPSWRRKRRKEQNTKRREGICKTNPHKFTKNGIEKKGQKTTGKLEKTIRTAAASRFLAAARIERNRDGGVNSKTRQKVPKLVRAREKWEKRHFKISSVLQPQAFFCLPKPIWSKIRTSEKTNLWDAEKIASKMDCNMKALQRVQCDPTRPRNAKLLRNPLFWSVSRPTTSWTAPGRTQTRNTRKKGKLFGPKKTTSTTSKMAFLKNPKNPKTVRIFGFRTPQRKPFRAIKTVVSKRGAANWP